MRDKLHSLPDAAALVQDGDQVIMSARMALAPMALLRELVRGGRSGLRLVSVVGGALNVDFSLGAGIAASLDTCSVTLGTYARAGPNFQRLVEAGRLRPLDNT